MPLLRVRYQTVEFGEMDIHLRTLRDKQQFRDIDGEAKKLGISSALWPLFGVIWPSSLVLAHFMVDYEYKNKRILEVGCGIALSSLMLNHLLADITATDYHPEAGNFLLENTELNKDRVIPFVRTDWNELNKDLGKFDVIVGSDLLYEDEHIDLLSDFIVRHTHPHNEVIIVDPGRGRHAKFSRKMVSLGYAHNQNKPENVDYLDQPFKGQILRYQR